MYLLLDIGGTNTRIGVSRDLKELDNHQTIPTDQNFEAGIDSVIQMASSLSDSQPFKGCAVGIREILDPKKERLINHPNTSSFPNWLQKPIKKILSQELNCQVFLENDAAMAALGEATWGAGVGYRVVGYLTISTGVGGAIVIEGHLDQGSIGFEPGEQLINHLGELIYFEDAVSGQALEKKYGFLPEEISDHAIWQKITKTVAVGIYNSMVFWSPDVVVLGGGVSRKISINDITLEVDKFNRKFPKLPPIIHSRLGDLSGLYGVLEYLRRHFTQTL